MRDGTAAATRDAIRAAAAAEGAEEVAGLVAAARGGDGEAFAALVERFRGPVAGYAAGLVHDRDLAEDVAQEAFLLAHRNLRHLREPSSFRAWLYRVVEHAAYSVRRRRSCRVLPPLSGEECLPVPPPGDEAAAHPAARALEAALDAIPPGYARALRLRYIEGLACPEVAESLGITTGNAKVRLHRARAALRRAAAAAGVPVPGGAA
jgi:RNA polymerase sigma-70 factor (ECF subfamily)